MIQIVIVLGVTLFVVIALIVLMLPKKSIAVTRLYEAVEATKETAETVESESPSIASMVGNYVSRVMQSLGLGMTPELERKLALAGYRQQVQIELYYAIRLLLPVVAAVVASFVVKENTVVWSAASAVVGYLAPDFWLSEAISRRREAIRLALPDAIDLLVICMEAGLGLDQALIRVGSEISITHPDLSEELRQINLEQRAGTPRIDAWRHMAERTRIDALRSFVSMLVQTDRFGTPISRSLGTFADGLRLQRQQKAEELAAKTTIKMVFPLVLFIFPSMFIVLLAPAIINIRNNFINLH